MAPEPVCLPWKTEPAILLRVATPNKKCRVYVKSIYGYTYDGNNAISL